MSTWRTGPNVLGIYLNDHLAGATAGAELARRAAGSAQDREDLEPARLDELIARARRQVDLLEELRVRAADQVVSLERAP